MLHVLCTLELNFLAKTYIICGLIYNNLILIKTFLNHQCVEQSGLDWNTIMECSQGKLGVQLQNEALELTGAIAPKFVPTIVYNNVIK